MCDALVALAPATAADVTLFAKNSDRPPAERQVIEWHPSRLDQGSLRTTHIDVEPAAGETIGCLLARPAWCWGAEHGVNEAGVAIGNEAIYTTLDPRPAPPALTGMDLVRLGLERADTATRAVEQIVAMLERYGQGGTGHDPDLVPGGRPYWSSFLVADPASAFVIETSGRTWAVEAVERARAISNRTTIAGFDAVHRHPRQPVDRLVDPRWHASQRVLAAEPVSVASLMQHLRAHEPVGEPGWSVCMHVPGVEETTASIVAELRAGERPVAWVLTGSPCAQPYRRMVVGANLGAELSGPRARPGPG